MKIKTFVKKSQEDFFFIVFIVLAVMLFFPEVFLLKQSFLSGDHRAQHYPWAFFYAQGLKRFWLPWWTSYFHSGFPLLAEGQVGAFYPLNLFFYFVFPPFSAYSYGILAHYLLGGLFFFGYLRSLKLSGWASLFGSLIYLFGTAQGGCYYNTISQKVLIWLPLTFYLSDQIIEKGKRSYALWLALILSVQVFGGYLQYAIYSIGFILFYFLWFSIRKALTARNKTTWISNAGLLVLALLFCFAIASPQLASTWELAGLSRRFSYPLEFAFVGSMNPLAFATLFFPHWDGFLRSEIYAGALGLYFLLLSFTTKKGEKEFFFWAMLFVALALALGKYNPLFVLVIKATGISALRVPAKFLFFAAYALAVLCAFGFDKWFQGRMTSGRSQAASKLFGVVSFLGIGGFFLSGWILRTFEPRIKGFLQEYVRTKFSGSPLHPWPLEHYFNRLETGYAEMLNALEIFNPLNLGFLGFIVLSMLWVYFSMRQKRAGWKAAAGFLAILFFNLYLYGGTSIKGNLEPYSFLEPPSKILDSLKEDRGSFRIHRVFESLESSDELALVPQTNMLYGLSMVGAYSPLVINDYYELLRGIGDVNDSQQLLVADKDTILRIPHLLDFLHVKYLLSDYPLSQNRFHKAGEGEGEFLYRNPEFLPRAFFVTRQEPLSKEKWLEKLRSPDFSPSRKVYILEEGFQKESLNAPEMFYPVEIFESENQQEIRLKVETPYPGYVVVSDIHYPGWRAAVNGVPSRILKANGIFRAVFLEMQGRYDIRMVYDPPWKKLIGVTLGLSFLCLLLPLFIESRGLGEFFGRNKTKGYLKTAKG
jgi:hypothetical protein